MRTKEQKLIIAETILEAYRKKKSNLIAKSNLVANNPAFDREYNINNGMDKDAIEDAKRNTLYDDKVSLSSIASKREPTEPKKTEYLKLAPSAQKQYDRDMEVWKSRSRTAVAQTRMRKKGNIPNKGGKPMFEDKNNKFIANQQWGKSLAGQTFYLTCPDNDKYYKTIFIRFNPFTNAMQPMISNPVYGIPPEGMDEINPLILQRLLRLQHTATFQGF